MFKLDVILSTAPRDHGLESAEKACRKSIEELDCGYLDLYLIHWPGVQKLKSHDPKNAQLRGESWRALEKLHQAGGYICDLTYHFHMSMYHIIVHPWSTDIKGSPIMKLEYSVLSKKKL